MENINTRINIDLLRPGAVQTVSVQQGDTARVLEIHLYDSTHAYPLTPDCYATFTARKPDGAVICNNCEILDGAVVYRFTSQTTSCAGGVEAQIRIYGADKQLITTAPIRLEVYGTVADPEEAGPVQDEMRALDALVCRTTEVCSSVEQKLKNGEFNGGYYSVAARVDGQTLVLTWTPSTAGMAAIPEQRVLLDIPGADPDDIAKAVADYLAAHPVEAPVTSVNNKTGAVVLTAADLFHTGSGLLLQDGVLSVDTADTVEQDNTLPVTSAAVYVEVGNIDALLSQI